MAHALPIAKLAGLLIKTLSKPLSKRVKHELSKSTMGTSLLNGIGQTSHNITSRMTIWSAGYKVRNIQPLPTDKAIQIGSEFVGESFVLIVSAGIIIYEYNRSKIKEVEKATKQHEIATQERNELQQQLTNIHLRINTIEESIQNILLQQQQQNEDDDDDLSKSKRSKDDEQRNMNKDIMDVLFWWRK